MDHTGILIVLILLKGCLVNGGVNWTEVAATSSNGFTTNMAAIGLTKSHVTTPIYEQTTHEASTVSYMNNQNITSTRAYNKMTSKELTSWLTEIQATFTSLVKTVPNTVPITQASTTQPTTVNNEYIGTTVPDINKLSSTSIRPTSYDQTNFDQNSFTRAVTSILTKLLSRNMETTTVADIVTRSSMLDRATTTEAAKSSIVGELSSTTTVPTSTSSSQNTAVSEIKSTTESNVFGEMLGTLPEVSKSTNTVLDTLDRNITLFDEALGSLPETPKTTDTVMNASDGSMAVFDDILGSLSDMPGTKDVNTSDIVLTAVDSHHPHPHTNGNGHDIDKELKEIQRRQLMELLKKINGTRRVSVRQLERLGLDMFTRKELEEIVRSMNMNIDMEKDNEKALNAENMGSVDEVISMDKLLIVVSTISGALILFIVIMCIIYCHKGKSEPNNESMKSDITLQLSRKSKSSLDGSIRNGGSIGNGRVRSDSFMGIPPNNEIWKDLQELPEAEANENADSRSIQSSKF